MRLRTLLAATAVGGGALALTNRSLRQSPDAFGPPLGRPQQTYRWRGLDVAYTEAGDPDDPDLVLLHGINAAASSQEFRYVVDALAEAYHVLAPDLPGFGHSERPPLTYSASLYTSFVREFLADRSGDATVLASSLTAAYVAEALADSAPDAETPGVRELLLVCPTATTVPGRRPWLRALVRSPLVGEGLFNALTARASIRHFLVDHGFADGRNVPAEWVEYDWQSAHQPGARYAPASFLAGLLDTETDLGDVLGGLDVPVTVYWGGEAYLPPLETGRELAEAAGARLVVFDRADLLPHAEFPDEFAETVLDGRSPAETQESRTS